MNIHLLIVSIKILFSGKGSYNKNSTIALAARKEFLASKLFRWDKDKPPTPLHEKALTALMEKFRILSSPNIYNAITTFQLGNATGDIDTIISLKKKSPYDNIQDSVFPG